MFLIFLICIRVEAKSFVVPHYAETKIHCCFCKYNYFKPSASHYRDLWHKLRKFTHQGAYSVNNVLFNKTRHKKRNHQHKYSRLQTPLEIPSVCIARLAPPNDLTWSENRPVERDSHQHEHQLMNQSDVNMQISLIRDISASLAHSNIQIPAVEYYYHITIKENDQCAFNTENSKTPSVLLAIIIAVL